MEKEVFYGVIALIIVLLLTSVYFNFEQAKTVSNKESKISSLSNQLDQTTLSLGVAKNNISLLSSVIKQKENLISSYKNQINSLGGQIQNLTTKVSDYQSKVSEQEKQISESSQQIASLSKLTETQKEQISGLVNDFSQRVSGSLIQENYGGSLVLYDDIQTYTEKSPLFAQIRAQPEDYSKLGIPFFYFKNSTKLTSEEQTILGEYSGLYDYIFIYRNTDNVRVIYHEIGHIIYKKFYEEIPSNLDMWNDYYTFLKNGNYLSTSYAYTDAGEGFAEEYAYYQTKENPNQHHQMYIFIDPINDWLKS